MKKITQLTALLFLAIFLLQSCVKDTCEQTTTWVRSTPIYKTQAQIDAISVTQEAPRALEEPGKIYFYNDYIFINEIRKGIHVIDNSDPSNPVNTGFIDIDGNIDIAVRNGRLYADSYMDLFILNVENPEYVTTVNRQKDVFERGWETGDGRIWLYNETELITEVLDCATRNAMTNRGGIFFQDDFALADNASGGGGGAELGGGGGNGTGGSMARFTLVDDYLYRVGNSDLTVISLANPDAPSVLNTVNLGWGIETIIPYGENLFIGSNSGMQIWDNSNPAEPTFLSNFEHARACDPVFVKDNYAYVTLRDGTFCEGFANQLDLIDISDLLNPTLEKTFQMQNPHGLSIDDNTLFLCEGEHGLKVFDIADPKNLDDHRRSHIKGINAYDVIALPNAENVLLLIGEDGFFQYDYSDPENLREISRILAE